MTIPAKAADGSVISSSSPSHSLGLQIHPGLLNLRGVVIATYHPEQVQAATSEELGSRPLLCDVLLYTAIPGTRTAVIPRCLAPNSSGAPGEGRTFRPRPARQNRRTGLPLNAAEIAKGNPMDYDGSHVIVGFLDNNFALPYIQTAIPHPWTSGDLPAYGGEPDMTTHRGVTWGVNDNGDFVVDAAGARDAGLNPDLSEPAPEGTGLSGNIRLRSQAGWGVLGPNAAIVGERTGTLAVWSGDADVLMGLRFDPTKGDIVLRWQRISTGRTSEFRIDNDGMHVVAGVDSLTTPTSHTANLEVTATDVTLTAEGDVTLGAPDQPAVLGDALVQAFATFISSPLAIDPVNGGSALLSQDLGLRFQQLKTDVQAALSASVKLKE